MLDAGIFGARKQRNTADIGEQDGFAGLTGGGEGAVGLAQNAEEEDVGGGRLVDEHDDLGEELFSAGELDGDDAPLAGLQQGDVVRGHLRSGS